MSLASFRPSVSVVIKTYDDSTASNRRSPCATLKEYLAMTLKALDRQTVRPCEILVVDSSLGNGIAKVIREHSSVREVDIRRIPLAQEMFSYSRALNIGSGHLVT
jgi:hypothetical protein